MKSLWRFFLGALRLLNSLGKKIREIRYKDHLVRSGRFLKLRKDDLKNLLNDTLTSVKNSPECSNNYAWLMGFWLLFDGLFFNGSLSFGILKTTISVGILYAIFHFVYILRKSFKNLSVRLVSGLVNTYTGEQILSVSPNEMDKD